MTSHLIDVAGEAGRGQAHEFRKCVNCTRAIALDLQDLTKRVLCFRQRGIRSHHIFENLARLASGPRREILLGESDSRSQMARIDRERVLKRSNRVTALALLAGHLDSLRSACHEALAAPAPGGAQPSAEDGPTHSALRIPAMAGCRSRGPGGAR